MNNFLKKLSPKRFVVKLTDFGLQKLRANSTLITKHSHQYYRSKFWTAPEVLRSDPELYQFYTNPSHPIFINSEDSHTAMLISDSLSVKADIYSFAIILHEIMFRGGAWGTNLDCREPEVSRLLTYSCKNSILVLSKNKKSSEIRNICLSKHLHLILKVVAGL